MQAAKLPTSDGFITNAINVYGPRLDKFITIPKVIAGGKNIKLTAEGEKQKARLLKELEQVKAKVIICAGNVPLYFLTNRWGITKWAGSVLQSEYTDIPIVATFHPDSILHGMYTNKWLQIHDLRKAADIIAGLYRPVDYAIKIAPTYMEVLDYLEWAYDKAMQGYLLAYDIEVSGYKQLDKQVSCISFCICGQTISIPFTTYDAGQEVDYFKPQEEANTVGIIAMILEDPKVERVAQNATFDAHFLLRRWGICQPPPHDTMIAQQLIMGEYRKGLDFITRMWTNQPYYKADGKDFIVGNGVATEIQRFWMYNGLDSAVIEEVLPKQLAEIKRQGNMPIYEAQRKLVPIITYMMERGMKVNVPKLLKKRAEMQDRAEAAIDELWSIAGRRLNPRSTKQLQEYFYAERGVKPYTNKQGRPTVDKLALRKLAKPLANRPAFKEASLILEIRRLLKLADTYLLPEKIDIDGRMRCMYNPAGTRFARMSSSESIFGTGMNLQNWPHELLGLLEPDEGYAYCSFDLSSAENRIVAYMANSRAMMEAFEDGKDVHAQTAEFIMSIFYGGNIPEDMTVKSLAPIGDGEHNWRDWGKRANHGLNYDFGFRAFALLYEILERDSRKICEGYHYLYPEIRSVYHAFLRMKLRENRTITNLMGRSTRFYGKLEDQTFKESYSFPPQSTVGDMITQWGMIPLFYESTFKDFELLNQVHDSIGFQFPLSIGWPLVAKNILKIKERLEQSLTAYNTGNTFSIPVDFCFGRTMNKDDDTTAFELKAKHIPSDSKKLAGILAEKWEALCQNGSCQTG